eukprot:1948021-Prymnesium_polylepis.1
MGRGIRHGARPGRGVSHAGPGRRWGPAALHGKYGEIRIVSTVSGTRCTWTKNTIRHSCWSAL